MEKNQNFLRLEMLKPCDVISCENLRSLIKSQLSQDIVKGSFDVGIVQNSTSAVSFRSPEDITEIWEQVR